MEEAVGSPEDKQLGCFSDAILIHKDSDILSVYVTKNIETAMEQRNWVELVSIVKEIIQKVKTTVKIAVTGDSGNGMSSFINALRNIGHEEEDSAPTGVVRTTQKPNCYSSSNFPDVELWDLPGTGATAQSMENYMDEMQINIYDLVIIIASEQFSLNHVKLAKAMQRMRKRFYVVWTKLDRDLSTSALTEAQLLQTIRRNIWENLQKEEVKEPPIFLVSTTEPSSHDFPKLRNMLQNDLSNIKYDDLLGTLFQIGEMTISKRVEFIKGSIDVDNLHKDFGILDPDNLIEIRKVFQETFGVDDELLQQVALSMGKPDVYYKNAMDIQIYQQDGWPLAWLYHSGTQLLFTSLNYMQCCFVSHHHRHMQQKYVLDEVAEKTKRFIRKILHDSIILSSEGLDN